MSPALAFVGISIVGTWGLASIGLIAAGIIMIFFPGEQATASGSTLPGIILLLTGLGSGALCMLTVGPLLGIDPPLPLKAKNIVPRAKMKRWGNAGALRDFPNGVPKEVRIRAQRVTIVRVEDSAYALNGLCPHARLPLAGFPGSPLKPYPVRDDCITCPLHGARFELATGKVVRQPFDSQWNAEHPFLGRLQEKLFFFNKKSEDIQTFPVRIEDGNILVGMPK